MASKYRYTKKSLEKRRDEVNKLKNKPCKRCGNSFPCYVMDWHHRDRANKKFGIGSSVLRRSLKILLLEIEKCDLYCSNCHRIVEFEIKEGKNKANELFKDDKIKLSVVSSDNTASLV